MATAFTRAMYDRIKAQGGWTKLFARIAAGESLTVIAKDLEVSRNFLSTIINKNPKLRELKHAAWKESGSVFAEKGLQVLQDAPVEGMFAREGIAKAKSLSDYYRWMAEKYDKEFFGSPKDAVNVNLQLGDIGQLHVHASAEARKHIKAAKEHKQIEATVEDSSGDVQPVQAEIISEGEPT